MLYHRVHMCPPRMIARLVCIACGLWYGGAAKAVDEDTGVNRQYQGAASLNGPLSPRTEWRLAGYVFWNGKGDQYASAEQAGVSWAARPWLSLSGAYRLSRVEDSAGTWNRQRAIGSVALSTHGSKLGFAYRLYWQGDWRDPGEKGFRDRSYLRNQLQLRYSVSERIAPYVSLELWNRIDPHRTRSGVDRTRYTLGTETRLTRHQSLGMYVRKQTFGNGDPDLFVFAAEYAYSLH